MKKNGENDHLMSFDTCIYICISIYIYVIYTERESVLYHCIKIPRKAEFFNNFEVF